mmetsp:Transcript_31921/g.95573  ORF Transcript_31921/g.95573 Transcript_31921/m.95573 type:complete len:164 (-) Transcript_31921:174-665(-)
MVRLDFSDNILRGEGIPSSIFKLKRLSYLGMHGNRFVGTISPNIGSLSRLQWLTLDGNMFNGKLPTEMGSLIALDKAFLSLNSFTGTIPMSFSHLTALKFLHLGFNSFTGDASFLCKKPGVHILADCYGDDPELFCSCCAGCCADEPEQAYTADVGLLGCFPN